MEMQIGTECTPVCRIKHNGEEYSWMLQWRYEGMKHDKQTISVCLKQANTGSGILMITNRVCLHRKLLQLWEMVASSISMHCSQDEFLGKSMASIPAEFISAIEKNESASV